MKDDSEIFYIRWTNSEKMILDKILDDIFMTGRYKYLDIKKVKKDLYGIMSFTSGINFNP